MITQQKLFEKNVATVSMGKGIKILDDAHACHWNINQKMLQKLDYDLLRNMFLKP